MNLTETLALIGTFGALALFVVYGVALFKNPALGMKLSGHSPDGMMPTVAGRYFMMGLLCAVFGFLQDFRALAVLFASFVFIAAIDAIIEPPRGGELWPHVTGGIAAAIICFICWSAYRGGDV